MEKDIRISDFSYELPDERIAKFPVEQRDQSKLLVYEHGHISETRFSHLPEFLPKNALMVFNNTRVIQARLHFRKETGALIEIFLLEPAEPADYEQVFQTSEACSWLCLVGNQKKWKEGMLSRMLEIKGEKVELRATRKGSVGTSQLIEFQWLVENETFPLQGESKGAFSFGDLLDAIGELPIPPYLNRDTEESDKSTYQTVYSRIKGSVAAPTAGLHFTEDVLKTIENQGITREEVTLHVGAGTFRPVKSETIEGHEMHSEHISVRRQTIENLIRHGGRAIAVGTTSVRTLESLYYMGRKILLNPQIGEEELAVKQWEPYENRDSRFEIRGTRNEERGRGNEEGGTRSEERDTVNSQLSTLNSLRAILDWLDRHQLDTLTSATQIIIVPGYEYKIVSHLVTNFHQPQSTLLLLVSAFVGGDWRRIYNYALDHDFRFLSYGDSSLLIP
ncbi:MAG: S-adenosylmethionine:tRNA ribosyltransferase-isomerase [Prevotella sp.]|nr:S-adenosylmethionine:tRNA ribosyltransferase-isomerase [Prevotella sp.]